MKKLLLLPSWITFHLCVDHVIWAQRLLLKLVLNIEWFLLLCYLNMLWNTFWGTFKAQKRFGDFIIKIAERFVLLYAQGVNKKVNKYFNIGHQLQILTPCPNDMIHTLFKKCLMVFGQNLEILVTVEKWPKMYWLHVGQLSGQFVTSQILTKIWLSKKCHNCKTIHEIQQPNPKLWILIFYDSKKNLLMSIFKA